MSSATSADATPLGHQRWPSDPPSAAPRRQRAPVGGAQAARPVPGTGRPARRVDLEGEHHAIAHQTRRQPAASVATRARLGGQACPAWQRWWTRLSAVRAAAGRAGRLAALDAASAQRNHPLRPGTRSRASAGLCPSTPRLARGHGVVLGHRAGQPGLDEDLGHLTGSCDLLGEIVVGAEVVVVEEADRERATPLRVDALDDPTLDDDREPPRSPPRAADRARSPPPLRAAQLPRSHAAAAGQRYWPGR